MADIIFTGADNPHAPLEGQPARIVDGIKHHPASVAAPNAVIANEHGREVSGSPKAVAEKTLVTAADEAPAATVEEIADPDPTQPDPEDNAVVDATAASQKAAAEALAAEAAKPKKKPAAKPKK